MKYLFLLAIGFVFAGSVLAQNSPAPRETTDPRATAILERMKAKFAAYKAMQADFRLTIELGSDREVQQGTMFVTGDKFRVETPSQNIISDGKTVWYHDKKNNQLQINNLDENVISPANLLKIYERGDKVICGLAGEATEGGKTVMVIEMKPTDRNAEYSKIRIYVEKGTDQLVKAIVFGKDSMRYTFEVSKITPNVSVGNDKFFFDQSKFSGEVIDLR